MKGRPPVTHLEAAFGVALEPANFLPASPLAQL